MAIFYIRPEKSVMSVVLVGVPSRILTAKVTLIFLYLRSRVQRSIHNDRDDGVFTHRTL